jgi:mannitol/fructose-specific phosphotransferase system IIA component (Ntr-type)
MVIPTATSAFYLKLIAGLSQTFREKEAREALLAVADDEQVLWNTLIRKTCKAIK